MNRVVSIGARIAAKFVAPIERECDMAVESQKWIDDVVRKKKGNAGGPKSA